MAQSLASLHDVTLPAKPNPRLRVWLSRHQFWPVVQVATRLVNQSSPGVRSVDKTDQVAPLKVRPGWFANGAIMARIFMDDKI
jgi:hypothetical protein